MVGIAEISAGLSSLKAAKDILKGLDTTRTNLAINEVKIELTSLILEAQESLAAAREAQSASASRIADLEQEIMRLKDWSAEKARYQLTDIGRGALVYTPKLPMDEGEPAHWLCANCFNHGRKSFMQFKGQDRTPGGGRADTSTYACDACKAALKVNYTNNPKRFAEELAAKTGPSD